MTHHLDLDAIVLKRGKHSRRGKHSVCVMEAVAWMAHEPHTDRPACVSPAIGAFLRKWNDDLDDETRQRLKPYITKVMGTNTGKADEETRAWMVTDWMVRTYMPAWLDLAGLTEQAATVRALPQVTSATAWKQNKAAVAAAWDAARAAAGDAAGAAAWAAARAAAWAAAGAAAGAAAWDAAGAAAWAAAWDAARAAAGDAAWDAAWDAARAAAWDAAWAAARAAAGDAAWDAAGDAAGDAAWDAARAALRPTAEGLQASAFELLDALCAVGQKAEVSA